jgi:hypothetical protein
MPRNVRNSAIDTTAARRRSEEVMPNGPSAGHPGERRDPYSAALVMKEGL